MLDFQPMPERRLVLVRAEGEVSGSAYVSGLMGLLQRDPSLLRCDFIYDLTRYEGGVTHDDLTELARRLDASFGAIDAGGATTVIVTPDAGYRFWVQLMEVQFPHRRFRWAPDMAAAEAALEAARAAISPAVPGRSC